MGACEMRDKRRMGVRRCAVCSEAELNLVLAWAQHTQVHCVRPGMLTENEGRRDICAIDIYSNRCRCPPRVGPRGLRCSSIKAQPNGCIFVAEDGGRCKERAREPRRFRRLCNVHVSEHPRKLLHQVGAGPSIGR